MPKVSICIPTYKQVQFLERTFRSLREQDFEDYEVIITDDSPDDGVERLVQRYRDTRWTYHRNSDRLGSPENWNAAIRLSSGELVKIMHHDDRFARPDALGRFVRMMDAHPECGFAFSATTVEDVQNERRFVHSATKLQQRELSEHPWILFAGNIIGAPSATIYRRADAMTYDNRFVWLVDLEFYYRMLERNPNFKFDPTELVITSHNAAHQVTQTVEGDASLVLREYLLFFDSLPVRARDDSRVIGTWHALMTGYQFGTLQEFLHRFPAAQQYADYFKRIFETKPSQVATFWHKVVQKVRRKIVDPALRRLANKT